MKDYVSRPKPNGYQSIHTTLVVGGGHKVEVQIRSYRMHMEAEHGDARLTTFTEQRRASAKAAASSGAQPLQAPTLETRTRDGQQLIATAWATAVNGALLRCDEGARKACRRCPASADGQGRVGLGLVHEGEDALARVVL